MLQQYVTKLIDMSRNIIETGPDKSGFLNINNNSPSAPTVVGGGGIHSRNSRLLLISKNLYDISFPNYEM